MQFYLSQTNIPELLQKYGKEICFSEPDFLKLEVWCKERTYCILIRLQDVEEIEPFDINKKGFGLMAAWITTSKVKTLTK